MESEDPGGLPLPSASGSARDSSFSPGLAFLTLSPTLHGDPFQPPPGSGHYPSLHACMVLTE